MGNQNVEHDPNNPARERVRTNVSGYKRKHPTKNERIRVSGYSRKYSRPKKSSLLTGKQLKINPRAIKILNVANPNNREMAFDLDLEDDLDYPERIKIRQGTDTSAPLGDPDFEVHGHSHPSVGNARTMSIQEYTKIPSSGDLANYIYTLSVSSAGELTPRLLIGTDGKLREYGTNDAVKTKAWIGRNQNANHPSLLGQKLTNMRKEINRRVTGHEMSFDMTPKQQKEANKVFIKELYEQTGIIIRKVPRDAEGNYLIEWTGPATIRTQKGSKKTSARQLSRYARGRNPRFDVSRRDILRQQ